MKHYIITGASSGIGKAIAEALLKSEDSQVYGLSRRQTVEHDRYKHLAVDLSDQQALIDFELPQIIDTEQIVLLNNAGTLGTVAHVGSLSDAEIAGSYNVNVLAPAILSNKFVKAYSELDCEKLIINISSGAASSPYDGWAVYCSSKAAVDMFSRTMAQEQEMKSNGVNVLAIAPGVVDTAMQTQIRSTDKSGFTRKDKFIELKESGSLYNAEDVADRFVEIFNDPDQVESIVSRISL